MKPAEYRWTANRKASVLDALDSGALTEFEAKRKYDLGPSELAEWRRRDAAGGTAGLFVKQTRRLR